MDWPGGGILNFLFTFQSGQFRPIFPQEIIHGQR